MAVSFVASGNGTATGTTNSASTVGATPTLPTGTASGDRVFVFQVATATSGTTPTSWTALYKDTAIASSLGAAAAGAGQRFESCYYRDYDGVWTMPSFTLVSSTQLSNGVQAITWRKGPTDTWNTPTFSGVGNYVPGTAATAFSAATAAFTTVAGGCLMCDIALNDNVTSLSAQTLTGTNGFTSGTVTYDSWVGTATGNDVSGHLLHCLPTAVASPAGTLTLAATLAAASQGGWIAVQQTVILGAPVQTDNNPLTVAVAQAINY